MSTVTYTIPAISCYHCIHTITMELGELEGVKSVESDLALKKITLVFEEPATITQIQDKLAEIDYPPEV
jgi:copper chaperone